MISLLATAIGCARIDSMVMVFIRSLFEGSKKIPLLRIEVDYCPDGCLVPLLRKYPKAVVVRFATHSGAIELLSETSGGGGASFFESYLCLRMSG